MSDTKTEHAHKWVMPPIERNGVTKTLSKMTFGKLSLSKGLSFYGPEFSQATWESDSKWVGLEWIVSVLNKRARKDFADIFQLHYYDDDGNPREVFPLEAYIQDCKDFTEGEAKLADLREDYDELVAQQQELAQSEAMSSLNEDGTFSDAMDEAIEKIKALAPKINGLKAQMKAISDRYQDRAEKRKAAKAAKEAAKAAIAGQVAVPA